MPTPPPPFTCVCTPAVADVLDALGASLIISTYQAGKVICLSPHRGGERITQYPRTFDKAMGLAVRGRQMGIATRNEVKLLANVPSLAAAYGPEPGKYDALFLPRGTLRTGSVDLHDLWFAPDGLHAVNTLFSCLCRLDFGHSFTPVWQPPFIHSLEPVDECHLNGVALVDGEPQFVTALGATNGPQGWRANYADGGVLLSVPEGEVIARGLAMPHSPRLWGGVLYILQSARGELCRMDLPSGKAETIARLPGFARGLARCGDYAFAGVSRLRSNHKFAALPIAKLPPFCGVVVIHLPTGAITGSIEYLSSCEEIYDVQVLRAIRRPAIARDDDPWAASCLALPGAAFEGDAET